MPNRGCTIAERPCRLRGRRDTPVRREGLRPCGEMFALCRWPKCMRSVHDNRQFAVRIHTLITPGTENGGYFNTVRVPAWTETSG